MSVSVARLNATIEEFQLSLVGKDVVTECATGHYSLTGPVAALAGAESVMCVGSEFGDYGSFEDARDQTMAMARRLGVLSRISFESRSSIRSRTAFERPTIITNLRGVRPVNDEVLRVAGKPSVVCTMSEAWELRAQDIDLSACKRNGTLVASTDEGHPRLNSIALVGLLCVQIAAANLLPLANARIGVIGSGKFAAATTRTLDQWNETFVAADPGSLEELLGELGQFDYVVDADHENAVLTASTASLLIQQARKSSVPIVALTGLPLGTDERYELIYPPRRVGPRQMTVALEALGPWPVLRLHTAGLRVGQLVLDNAFAGESEVLRCEFVEALIAES